MFASEIFDFAQAGLGQQADAALMEKLCSAASAELLSRLKQGVDVESIKELFVTAAGVLALSMYCAIGGDGENFSFKAGNLSVSRSGGDSGADSLRKTAENMLACYLADQGFEFRSVEG